MSIDISGRWWVGSEPEDIRGFLEDYASEGYEVDEFRLARCSCGSDTFFLDADDSEGVAKRTCSRCSREHFICDSEKFWADASPERCKCVECGSDQTNVGVGFSLYDGSEGGIRWLYVGVRCPRCGILGCFAGWKIAEVGTEHLMEKV